MAFRIYFLIFGLLLLVSCAQVTTLSGGNKDSIAPKPIAEKTTPLAGSINFTGNSIAIPFDEFVKLDNPSEKIFIIPPHTKLHAKLEKKTLQIHWEDTLKANTTYTIYMNRAVKDITENNDSIMQYVFSTGNYIDSMTYQVKVEDAIKSVPVAGCLVGLYTGRTDSILPTYFAETSGLGIAKLNYLKRGKYTLIAFEDKNKDLIYQKTEKIAFRAEKIQLDSSTVDTIPLRLFVNEDGPKLTTIKFQAPSQFEVEANRSLKNGTYQVNGKQIDSKEIKFITDLKIQFWTSAKDTSFKEIQFVSKNQFLEDTISLRILAREKLGRLRHTSNGANLLATDTLKFQFTDRIATVDTALIKLKNKKDSTGIKLQKVEVNQNELWLFFPKKGVKEMNLLMKPKAVITNDAFLSDTLKMDISIKEEKDFGAIKLDATYFKSPIIVEVLKGTTVVQTLPLQGVKKTLIQQLEPAEYTFKVVLDENQNGKWDTGDFEKQLQPEQILWFSDPFKVRANWEIDLKLIPKGKNE